MTLYTIDDMFSEGFRLENKVVLLRPLLASDRAAFRKIVFDDKIWSYYTSNIAADEDLDVFIADALQNRDNRSRCVFTVICKETGEIAGSTSYGNISGRDKRLEIGWTWLSPEFQKTGLNRNNKFLLLQNAFERLGLERVEFKTDVLNLAARKGLKGIGATEEGVLRSHTLMPFDRRRDTIYYSILKDEWPHIKETIFAGYDSLL